MALTVTNTNTMTLLNILNRTSSAQSSTLKQLTTGKRINAGKDDPAGLIALETLNAELTAVNSSLTNNQRTDSMLTVMDSSITEISGLLGDIETLIVSSTSEANLSDAEVAANQSQIDDALAAIDRIVRTTNFAGKSLLDGSLSIQTEGVATNEDIDNLRVFSRSQSASDSELTVQRVASAQHAEVEFAAAGSGDTTDGETEVTIAGELGIATLTLASGLTQSEIVTAINAAKDQTGVSATADASSITLNSTGYGRDAFISVEVLSGGAINDDSDPSNDIQSVGKTIGVDAEVTINGQATGADGLDITYSANGLSLAFSLGEDFGTGVSASETTEFTVKAAGGATFQLGTTTGTRSTIGLDSLATYSLGGGNGTARLSELRSGGAKDLQSDVGGALSSVREAISEVAAVRGRIGGFQKFQVGSSIRSLQAAQTGLTEATSVIGDTDYAMATSRLNKETVLIQSAVQLLGVANQQAAQILSLL